MPVGTPQALITLCPGCFTAFRASAAQLMARNGQVRCGRCGRVFDAHAQAVALDSEAVEDGASASNLPEAPQDGSAAFDAIHDAAHAPPSGLETSAESEREFAPGATAGQAFDAASGHADLAPERSASEASVSEDAGLTPTVAGAPARGPWSEPLTEPVTANSSASGLQGEDGIEPFSAAPPPAESFPEPALGEAAEPPGPAGSEPQAPDAIPEPPALADVVAQPVAPDTTPLGFGRTRRRAARLPRWLSIPAAVLLVAVLLAQVAYTWRSDLLVLAPGARPAAERLCARLPCDLPLPHRVDLLSIESSDLQAVPDNPDVMVLSATLRNRAPFAQARPALELTLTDSDEHAVARRVLTAADYAPGGTPANSGVAPRDAGFGPHDGGFGPRDGGFAAGAELPLKLYFQLNAIKATGYRLYLFYP